jgi:hypothetical protein
MGCEIVRQITLVLKRYAFRAPCLTVLLMVIDPYKPLCHWRRTQIDEYRPTDED